MSEAPNWVQNSVGSVSNTIAGSAGLDANNAQTMLNFFEQNRDFNNAWSASQARIQREWQEEQNAKAMAFNQSEAQKNRDWQQMMSNTAHQREIADLKAAGLNPILSAMNGNGASVTSGATASGVTSSGASGQTDTSMNQMVMTLMSSFLDAQTRLAEKSITAVNNLAVAEKNGEINENLKNLQHELDVKYTEKFPNNGWQALYGLLGLFSDVLNGVDSSNPIGSIITGAKNAFTNYLHKQDWEKYMKDYGSDAYGPVISGYAKK